MRRTSNKLGIDVQVRAVDPAQFQHLTDDFDFDMIFMIYPEGDVPGQELRDYWSCAGGEGAGQLRTCPASAIRRWTR